MSDKQITIKAEIPQEIAAKLDAILSRMDALDKKTDVLLNQQTVNTSFPVPGRTTIKSFCQTFGISVPTYYSKVKDGMYPAPVRVGGRPFLNNADILKWAEANHLSA